MAPPRGRDSFGRGGRGGGGRGGFGGRGGGGRGGAGGRGGRGGGRGNTFFQISYQFNSDIIILFFILIFSMCVA